MSADKLGVGSGDASIGLATASVVVGLIVSVGGVLLVAVGVPGEVTVAVLGTETVPLG
jgi:hypothetical protein